MMINKAFPYTLGFSVAGSEVKNTSQIREGGDVTESSEFTATNKDGVSLQSEVRFNAYVDKGTVKLTDADSDKNLRLSVDSKSGLMSVTNRSRDGLPFPGETVEVDVETGKFQAAPELESSLAAERFASITMTSEGLVTRGSNARTEFSLERTDGSQRKLVLQGGLLVELDEPQG